MTNSIGSDRHAGSGSFLPKARRLALRLVFALILVGGITFVFARVIRVNATSAGFFYLVAILMIATAWGLAESTVASVVAMLPSFPPRHCTQPKNRRTQCRSTPKLIHRILLAALVCLCAVAVLTRGSLFFSGA